MKKILSLFLLITFAVQTVVSDIALAQMVPSASAAAPLTAAFTPVLVRGITLYPDNPLKFNFLIDPGDQTLSDDHFQKESMKLIRYFLAALTTPEEDMWVNLNPQEKDRIVPLSFGQTDMGQELLDQDYLLKQLTASLLNPDDKLGKEFWARVYSEAHQKFGTTEIPLETLSKVWIVPDRAEVLVKDKTVVVTQSHLKILMEKDYSLQSAVYSPQSTVDSRQQTVDKILKEIIIPAIEREVNEGKSFAPLRQIQNSAILAAWYKKNLKRSLLGSSYVDQKKIQGIDTADKDAALKIYNQYLEAFKKGAYNTIKEDYNPDTQEVVSKKYVTGGAKLTDAAILSERVDGDLTMLGKELNHQVRSVEFRLEQAGKDAAMTQSIIVPDVYPREKDKTPVKVDLSEAKATHLQQAKELILKNNSAGRGIETGPFMFEIDYKDNPFDLIEHIIVGKDGIGVHNHHNIGADAGHFVNMGRIYNTVFKINREDGKIVLTDGMVEFFELGTSNKPFGDSFVSSAVLNGLGVLPREQMKRFNGAASEKIPAITHGGTKLMDLIDETGKLKPGLRATHFLMQPKDPDFKGMLIIVSSEELETDGTYVGKNGLTYELASFDQGEKEILEAKHDAAMVTTQELDQLAKLYVNKIKQDAPKAEWKDELEAILQEIAQRNEFTLDELLDEFDSVNSFNVGDALKKLQEIVRYQLTSKQLLKRIIFDLLMVARFDSSKSKIFLSPRRTRDVKTGEEELWSYLEDKAKQYRGPERIEIVNGIKSGLDELWIRIREGDFEFYIGIDQSVIDGMIGRYEVSFNRGKEYHWNTEAVVEPREIAFLPKEGKIVLVMADEDYPTAVSKLSVDNNAITPSSRPSVFLSKNISLELVRESEVVGSAFNQYKNEFSFSLVKFPEILRQFRAYKKDLTRQMSNMEELTRSRKAILNFSFGGVIRGDKKDYMAFHVPAIFLSSGPYDLLFEIAGYDSVAKKVTLRRPMLQDREPTPFENFEQNGYVPLDTMKEFLPPNGKLYQPSREFMDFLSQQAMEKLNTVNLGDDFDGTGRVKVDSDTVYLAKPIRMPGLTEIYQLGKDSEFNSETKILEGVDTRLEGIDFYKDGHEVVLVDKVMTALMTADEMQYQWDWMKERNIQWGHPIPEEMYILTDETKPGYFEIRVRSEFSKDKFQYFKGVTKFIHRFHSRSMDHVFYIRTINNYGDVSYFRVYYSIRKFLDYKRTTPEQLPTDVRAEFEADSAMLSDDGEKQVSDSFKTQLKTFNAAVNEFIKVIPTDPQYDRFRQRLETLADRYDFISSLTINLNELHFGIISEAVSLADLIHETISKDSNKGSKFADQLREFQRQLNGFLQSSYQEFDQLLNEGEDFQGMGIFPDKLFLGYSSKGKKLILSWYNSNRFNEYDLPEGVNISFAINSIVNHFQRKFVGRQRDEIKALLDDEAFVRAEMKGALEQLTPTTKPQEIPALTESVLQMKGIVQEIQDWSLEWNGTAYYLSAEHQEKLKTLSSVPEVERYAVDFIKAATMRHYLRLLLVLDRVEGYEDAVVREFERFRKYPRDIIDMLIKTGSLHLSIISRTNSPSIFSAAEKIREQMSVRKQEGDRAILSSRIILKILDQIKIQAAQAGHILPDSLSFIVDPTIPGFLKIQTSTQSKTFFDISHIAYRFDAQMGDHNFYIKNRSQGTKSRNYFRVYFSKDGFLGFRNIPKKFVPEDVKEELDKGVESSSRVDIPPSAVKTIYYFASGSDTHTPEDLVQSTFTKVNRIVFEDKSKDVLPVNRASGKQSIEYIFDPRSIQDMERQPNDGPSLFLLKTTGDGSILTMYASLFAQVVQEARLGDFILISKNYLRDDILRDDRSGLHQVSAERIGLQKAVIEHLPWEEKFNIFNRIYAGMFGDSQMSRPSITQEILPYVSSGWIVFQKVEETDEDFIREKLSKDHFAALDAAMTAWDSKRKIYEDMTKDSYVPHRSEVYKILADISDPTGKHGIKEAAEMLESRLLKEDVTRLQRSIVYHLLDSAGFGSPKDRSIQLLFDMDDLSWNDFMEIYRGEVDSIPTIEEKIRVMHSTLLDIATIKGYQTSEEGKNNALVELETVWSTPRRLLDDSGYVKLDGRNYASIAFTMVMSGYEIYGFNNRLTQHEAAVMFLEHLSRLQAGIYNTESVLTAIEVLKEFKSISQEQIENIIQILEDPDRNIEIPSLKRGDAAMSAQAEPLGEYQVPNREMNVRIYNNEEGKPFVRLGRPGKSPLDVSLPEIAGIDPGFAVQVIGDLTAQLELASIGDDEEDERRLNELSEFVRDIYQVSRLGTLSEFKQYVNFDLIKLLRDSIAVDDGDHDQEIAVSFKTIIMNDLRKVKMTTDVQELKRLLKEVFILTNWAYKTGYFEHRSEIHRKLAVLLMYLDWLDDSEFAAGKYAGMILDNIEEAVEQYPSQLRESDAHRALSALNARIVRSDISKLEAGKQVSLAAVAMFLMESDYPLAFGHLSEEIENQLGGRIAENLQHHLAEADYAAMQLIVLGAIDAGQFENPDAAMAGEKSYTVVPLLSSDKMIEKFEEIKARAAASGHPIPESISIKVYPEVPGKMKIIGPGQQVQRLYDVVSFTHRFIDDNGDHRFYIKQPLRPYGRRFFWVYLSKYGNLGRSPSNARSRLPVGVQDELRPPKMETVSTSDSINAPSLDSAMNADGDVMDVGAMNDRVRQYSLVKNKGISKLEVVGQGELRITLHDFPNESFVISNITAFGYSHGVLIVAAKDLRLKNPQAEFVRIVTEDMTNPYRSIRDVKRGELTLDEKRVLGIIHDRAMTGDAKSPGGIDLNPNQTELKEQGSRIDFEHFYKSSSFTPEQINVNGFVPVILQISPPVSLPFLLGMSQDREPIEKLAQVPAI